MDEWTRERGMACELIRGEREVSKEFQGMGLSIALPCSGKKQRRDNSRCHGRLSKRGATLVGSWRLK